MGRRLPPLNSLKAFEAAARHLSFTKAAEELFVTQAAISHQVKTLEEHLGLTLFKRFNRRLLLTDAGQNYYPELREIFDSLDQATRRLSLQEEGTLRISVQPSFAAKWLMPRLPAFRERQPDIDVLISASDQLVNFNQEDFHMGIRYGWGQYPGLHTTLMMEDVIFPVCAPRLIEGAQPLKKPNDLGKYTLLQRPQDLSRYTLLHDDMARRDETSNDWATWLEHAGLSDIDPYKGPAFSHSSLALTAAIDGQGVALGRLTLVVDDLAAGRLVCPFGPIIEAPMKYYIVSPAPIAERPIVRQFREWLLEEAAKTPVRPVNLPDGFQTSLPPTS